MGKDAGTRLSHEAVIGAKLDQGVRGLPGPILACREHPWAYVDNQQWPLGLKRN